MDLRHVCTFPTGLYSWWGGRGAGVAMVMHTTRDLAQGRREKGDICLFVLMLIWWRLVGLPKLSLLFPLCSLHFTHLARDRDLEPHLDFDPDLPGTGPLTVPWLWLHFLPGTGLWLGPATLPWLQPGMDLNVSWSGPWLGPGSGSGTVRAPPFRSGSGLGPAPRLWPALVTKLITLPRLWLQLLPGTGLWPGFLTKPWHGLNFQMYLEVDLDLYLYLDSNLYRDLDLYLHLDLDLYFDLCIDLDLDLNSGLIHVPDLDPDLMWFGCFYQFT